ncbi:MAG TPA: tetratricopeptide repeat protein [Burkholderiaceae bacterium]|nr:tetratricopeptide repeat protein [Burkholderiaceae bacterium]
MWAPHPPASPGVARLRRASRPLRFAALAALALACAVCAPALAKQPRHVVKDPYYGDSLFYFFQQRYFTSVTDLMVSQHFARLTHHADEAELLRGGLYLSYGMHREAGDIFTQLIQKGAKPDVRDRAWYYLAKIRYQRDLPGQAEEALSHVGDSLPPQLEEDRALLQANLLMARHDYADAARTLKKLADDPDADVYIRYNLGVALIKNGEVDQGTALLDRIGQAPAEDEELLSLRDKANVALGFTALQNSEPERARTYLQRVRLSGMLANKALLGFGWAAASLKQPKDALVPWIELAKRDTADAAVLEAKLAVPYAMSELGAYAQSLELYNDAIGVFERERARLDESIAAIRAGKLVEGLLERNPGEEMGWFWSIDRLPTLPHPEHLTPVLAQHDFQEAFKNYRDLLFLSRNLQRWQDSLGIYGDMLTNRAQAYAERLPRVRARASAVGLDALEQHRMDLTRELTWAEAQSNVYALADPMERALAERLARARAALEQAGEDPQLDAQRERYRRVAGALTWRLTQEFPDHLWQAKKRLRELDEELGQARDRDTALAQAQREEPAHFQQFAARIAQLDWRIRSLQPHVAELVRDQQQYIQELAVAELQRQKDRLANYATQARFAVARIYDRANVGKATDVAPGEAGHGP